MSDHMHGECVYIPPNAEQMFDVPDLMQLMRSGEVLPRGTYMVRAIPPLKPIEHLVRAMARFGLRLERP